MYQWVVQQQNIGVHGSFSFLLHIFENFQNLDHNDLKMATLKESQNPRFPIFLESTFFFLMMISLHWNYRLK